jgi:PAS domain S-box-containing protein
MLAVGAGLGALILLEQSAENSATFSRWYPWILLANGLAAVALGVLLARQLLRLYSDFKHHVPGSRLTARTVGIMVALVIVPVLTVYLFSLGFLYRGIDSWFRIEIKQGLNDALVLSRSALELRQREQSRRTDSFARSISQIRGAQLQMLMDAERRSTEAGEIIVYGSNGRPIAVSDAPDAPGLPGPAPAEVLLQVTAGRNFVSLEPVAEGRYRITTAAPVPGRAGDPERRYVLINYDVPIALAGLADAVQRAYSQYGDLSVARQPVMAALGLTLSLVLLLTILAAIYGAIFSARRLTRPVQDLIAGTRAVGKGDFDTRLPLPSRDEMGFLVHSFNDMTKRLRRASAEAVASREAVERERERLQVILSHLSSGVMVIDSSLIVRSANQAAGAILGADLAEAAGHHLASIGAEHSRLAKFASELSERLAVGRREWREQLNLSGEPSACMLLWACTPLPDEGEISGLVIVFEDITALLTAQRSAAWGEVARRLAHEIKNPLTPIQLSAERLRRKLATGLDSEGTRLLERATHTIVQQVDAMKQMVDAFSEYARTPEMQVTHFNFNQLASEVAELYRLQDPGAQISLVLDPASTLIAADRGRMRQVLANLISNAMEAVAGVSEARIHIGIRPRPDSQQLEIAISDNGPGFREEMLARAFEPYVTGKPRGTGLGLAIVKRIIEEHGGQIAVENLGSGGARITILLPAEPERRTELRR